MAGEVTQAVLEPVEAAAAATGQTIASVTAYASYAFGKVRSWLAARHQAPIAAKVEPIKARVPLRRFCYDAKRDIARCSRGKVLMPGRDG